MNDAMVSLELERLEYLDGESSDQTRIEALELILLDELVQVHGEKLEGE
jgi:hypothetical protein